MLALGLDVAEGSYAAWLWTLTARWCGAHSGPGRIRNAADWSKSSLPAISLT